MPSISGVTIENFRSFARLEVANLTRLNLIVGANDAGKSALLEALEWHLSGASPERLFKGLERRGAFLELDDEAPLEGVDVTGLFHGRKVDPLPLPKVGRFGVSDDHEQHSEAELLAFPAHEGGTVLHLRCLSGERLQPEFRLLARCGVLKESRRDPRADPKLIDRANVYLVPAGIPTARDFAPLWKSLVATPDEDLVVELLRLVEPRINKFAVVSSSLATSGYSGIVLLLKDNTERLPLSDFGDGMKRMAFFACVLAKCRGGAMLIDELDDGLHYSVLPKLWEFLIAAARKLDVQVFATTHSKDCLEAIAALHAQDPALTADLTIHRLDKGAARSASVSADAAAGLIDTQVELR